MNNSDYSHLQTPNIPLTDLFYLAGYFDGEGCVCCTQVGKSFYVTITVCTSDKEILDLFATHFGGEVRKKAQSKNRQMYHWTRCGIKAQNTLYLLYPFLRGKKEVALLAMLPDYMGGIVPEKELKLRSYIHSKISAINQRVTV